MRRVTAWCGHGVNTVHHRQLGAASLVELGPTQELRAAVLSGIARHGSRAIMSCLGHGLGTARCVVPEQPRLAMYTFEHHLAGL